MSLQMMPGGMMPSGWDWGSMWLSMLLPAVAVTATVLIIVVLLLRQGQNHPPAQPSSSSFTPQMTGLVKQPVSPTQPKNEALGEAVRSLGPTLMDDERRIMDEMVIAGGEVLQSDLPKMTGFSKATVSKAIHGLEVRGIVVREKHKWTYWCKVNPRLVERLQGSEHHQPQLPATEAALVPSGQGEKQNP